MANKNDHSRINFMRDIQRIVSRYANEPLLWTSEGDCVVDYVTLPAADNLLDFPSPALEPGDSWDKLLTTQMEAHVSGDSAEQALDDMINNAVPVARLLLLHSLFAKQYNRRNRVVKVEVAPSTYDLYIVFEFSFWWCGVRTTVIES